MWHIAALSPQKFNSLGKLVATEMGSPPVWPTYQATAARTGHHPTQEPPSQPLQCQWTFDTTAIAEEDTGVSGIKKASPTIGDETLYFTTDAGDVCALDIDSGTSRWQYTVEDYIWISTAPTITDDNLFVGFDSVLYAFDRDTGNIEWSVTTGEEAIRGAPTVVGDLVVVQSDQVYGIDRETGAVEWAVETTGDMQSYAAVIDETVFVAAAAQLYAIDATVGSKVWTTDLDNKIATAPVATEKSVFVGDEEGSLFAIDPNIGEKEWCVDVGTDFVAPPAVANGSLFIGNAGVWDDRKNLYALDTEDGTIKWTFGESSECVKSAPVVVADTVLTGYSGRLYALAADTGAEKWSVRLRGTSLSAPAIADETVFIESTDQYLYALTSDTST